MFITFRESRTQTLVMNVEAYWTMVRNVISETHLSMKITDTQVIFQLNSNGEGVSLFKVTDHDLRKGFPIADWIKPLRDAQIPFGRMPVRFDAETKSFIYENIDKQFPMEIQQAQWEADLRNINTKALAENVKEGVAKVAIVGSGASIAKAVAERIGEGATGIQFIDMPEEVKEAIVLGQPHDVDPEVAEAFRKQMLMEYPTIPAKRFMNRAARRKKERGKKQRCKRAKK